MASVDVALMKGNVFQSALVSLIAGGTLAVFKPTPETFTRLLRGLVVGCAKRCVNGLAVYGLCSTVDYLRRKGTLNLWFFKNKIGSVECENEYFMSSSFRFVTFAASSGPSCVTNYLCSLIRVGGPRKANAASPTTGAVVSTDNDKKKAAVFSRLVQCYDVEGRLPSYTNPSRLLLHAGVFGLSSVAMGSGLLPVTAGPIDTETHVRVLRSCGPSEIAYWSTLTALSTLAAETTWNMMFLALNWGSSAAIVDEETGRSSTLGFTVFATAAIGIAAAALNGATVFVISNRAVALLGDDGEKKGEGVLYSVCKGLQDKVLFKILAKEKGVAYIWARAVSFVSSLGN